MEREIRKLLVTVEKAFAAFKSGYKKDVVCERLFENFTDTLDKELGEYELKYDYLCGKDSVNIDGISKGYIPRMGDTVVMDISVGKNNVWCDVCRTYFIGEPNSEQRKVYEMIRRSIKAGEQVLKDGAKASGIYQAVNGVFALHGQELVHHAGHRIGTQPLMQPQFLSQNNTAIETHTAYTIESGSYLGFGIRLENDYYIEKDGAENLFEDLMPLDIKEYVLK